MKVPLDQLSAQVRYNEVREAYGIYRRFNKKEISAEELVEWCRLQIFDKDLKNYTHIDLLQGIIDAMNKK